MLRRGMMPGAALLLLSAVKGVGAATIEKVQIPDFNAILVIGELLNGDDKKFADAALGMKDAVVILASPGGSLMAGLEIGKAIHLKGFTTSVAKGETCASACALAWLGGRSRDLFPGARVGFHAAYYKDDAGRLITASSGNALVGAYLNQIGMSSNAIVFVTSRPPSDIAWLTQGDAARNGIDMKQVEEGNISGGLPVDTPAVAMPQRIVERGMAPKPVRSIPIKPEPDYAGMTVKLIGDYWGSWSADNASAIAFLDRSYGDSVDFFGKPLSKWDVLNEKRKFSERWSDRTYTPSAAPLAQCDTVKLECSVTGTVEWDVRNNAKRARSRGYASYEFVVNFNSSVPKIVGEKTSLMSRVKSTY